jgi:miniconductance mechanosensitive channel
MLVEIFSSFLKNAFGVPDGFAAFLAAMLLLFAVFAGAYVIKTLVKYFVVKAVHKVNPKARWLDALIKNHFFSKIFQFIPALVIYSSASVTTDSDIVVTIIHRLSLIYIVLVSCMVINAALSALNNFYHQYEFANSRPIKSYLQMAIVLVYIVSGILIVSVIINQSSWTLIKALGAVTAILALVFKDAILGLVASIQLSADDMIRKGDWIEMSTHNADGIVMDITLNTVKVRNWDNTITTIPAQDLIHESFKNWRGMEDSGGRLLKRSINIDMESIRFCDSAMLDRFKKIELLKDFLKDAGDDESLTNSGIFREYIKLYLQKHKNIKDREMLFFIRQLDPTEHGLPLQVFAFVDETKDWAAYEEVQAEIFDHIIASVKQFALRIHQSPGGHDIREAFSRKGTDNSEDC